MSTRTYNPTLVWTPIRTNLGPDITQALAQCLETWRGTPYESGQRFAGRACDCLGGVCGVIDQADGRFRAEYPGMPHDSALHNRASAIAAIRELLKRYDPCAKVEPDAQGIYHVEPGDVVVTGQPGGGPGHVAIVGTEHNHLWHAMPGSGFHQGGWSLLVEQQLYAVYRIGDKWRWAF